MTQAPRQRAPGVSFGVAAARALADGKLDGAAPTIPVGIFDNRLGLWR